MQSGGLTAGYDGDGNRVYETVGGVTTQYLIDTENPTGLPQIMDELQNGTVVRTYSYGLERISENQLIGGTWTPSLYGYDGHGSVRFLTNMSGSVTDTYNYDAFGNVISSTGSTPNEFLFAGEQFDPALGFYYLRARYYRPATGRFWTPDPIEGKLCCGMSWNPYIYTRDNPENFVDPSGRDAEVEYSLFQKVAAVTTIISVVGSSTTALIVCTAEAVESLAAKAPTTVAAGPVVSSPIPSGPACEIEPHTLQQGPSSGSPLVPVGRMPPPE